VNAVVLKSCCACHFTVFVFSIIKLSFWILGFTDSASIGEHGSSNYRDLVNSDKHLIVKDFSSTVAFKYVNQRFTIPLTCKGRDRLISSSSAGTKLFFQNWIKNKLAAILEKKNLSWLWPNTHFKFNQISTISTTTYIIKIKNGY